MNKSIKTEIIIHATKEAVWKALTDFSRYPDWNPFIIKAEGSVEQGARLKNTLKNGEKTFVFRPFIQEVIPYRSFSWLGSLFVKGLFDGLHYFEIEEMDSRRVKLIHGERFSGLLSGMILKKVGADTRNNFVRMNQALKQYTEQLEVPA